MGEVTRYRQCAEDSGIVDEMRMHTEGEWVEYSDYAELEAKLKDAEAENKRFKQALEDIAQGCYDDCRRCSCGCDALIAKQALGDK